MNVYYTTFSTPLGDFTVAVDAAGAVAATAFGGSAALPLRGERHVIRDIARTAPARHQLSEYFRGHRRIFDLPLANGGTPFQQRVWAELGRIPYGETRSYAEIAVALDAPAAVRAVGRANAANPICVIVPCHRVIGSDGSLTGFAFGEALKRELLALEAAAMRTISAA
jgi:methylated-DNA-[protein]-cysteine S-methyltransferase